MFFYFPERGSNIARANLRVIFQAVAAEQFPRAGKGRCDDCAQGSKVCFAETQFAMRESKRARCSRDRTIGILKNIAVENGNPELDSLNDFSHQAIAVPAAKAQPAHSQRLGMAASSPQSVMR